MNARNREFGNGSWCWSEPGPLPKSTVAAAFEANGLPMSGTGSTARNSLKEAAMAVARAMGRNTVVDSLRTKGLIGFEAVEVFGEDDKHNKRNHLFSVVLDGEQVRFTSLPGRSPEQVASLERTVTNFFHEREQWMPTTTLSSLLQAAILRDMGGTKCRKAGVVFFVPPWGVEILNRLSNDLHDKRSDFLLTTESASLFQNERTLDLVARSFREQMQAVFDEVNAEVESLQGKAYENGTKSRLDRLLKARQKIDRYEEFLGIQLDDLRAVAATTEDIVNEAAVAALVL